MISPATAEVGGGLTYFFMLRAKIHTNRVWLRWILDFRVVIFMAFSALSGLVYELANFKQSKPELGILGKWSTEDGTRIGTRENSIEELGLKNLRISRMCVLLVVIRCVAISARGISVEILNRRKRFVIFSYITRLHTYLTTHFKSNGEFFFLKKKYPH